MRRVFEQIPTVPIQRARSNFDNFAWSFITVFQVGGGGETWNEVISSAIYGSGYWTVLYFVPVYIMGNFFLVNLLTAVLITNIRKARLEAAAAIRPRKRSGLLTKLSELSSALPKCCVACWRQFIRCFKRVRQLRNDGRAFLRSSSESGWWYFPFCCLRERQQDEVEKKTPHNLNSAELVSWVN